MKKYDVDITIAILNYNRQNFLDRSVNLGYQVLLIKDMKY